MFGRQSSTATIPDETAVVGRDEVVDAPVTDVVDETDTPAEVDNTQRIVASPRRNRKAAAEPVVAEPVASERFVDEPVAAEPVAAEPVVAEPVTSKRVVTEPVVAEPVAVREPVTEPVTETVTEPETVVEPEPVVEPKRGWAHVSVVATLCFFIGTLAVAATATGLLAPFGFAGGVLAILLGIAATFPINRPAVTGHSLVGLGVFFGLVAVVVSVLAMGGNLSWLSSKTNEVTVFHNWLNSHMSWVNHWS